MATELVLVNESTVVPHSAIPSVALALTDQCGHLAQAGYMVYAQAFPSGHRSAPRDSWRMVIRDDSDVEGALGYHSTLRDGTPVSFVFARTCMEGGYPWTGVASHEAVEKLVDANARLAVDLGPDETGDRWFAAWEVADPVQADYYEVEVRAHGLNDTVLVSNFIRPNWFEPYSRGPWDWMGVLDGPLVLSPGGYLPVCVGDEWVNVYNDDPRAGKAARQRVHLSRNAMTRGAQITARAVPIERGYLNRRAIERDMRQAEANELR